MGRIDVMKNSEKKDDGTFGQWIKEAYGGRMPMPMEVDPRLVPRETDVGYGFLRRTGKED